MVDALFQIVLPELNQLNGLTIEQPVYEWDGIAYPQGPKTVSLDEICLRFDAKSWPVEKFLPSNYIEQNWKWLSATDETLDRYEISVNSLEERYFADKFEETLRLLLGQSDRWVVAYLWQYDQIDWSYQLNPEDCISKLRAFLIRDNPNEGFVAYL